ncbi:MAG: GTP cyclohydrolase MptA [Candidatus Thermoplasmatota archaeon]|jgi:GTP cyclohydrolase-4|nr:GTP cyclohydrolase MptA [Candidatus Thermoplasmatota archaeon]MCL5983523.1 GTP cyclohydrolase MptA [Candidatus Thermoplasmatota archaeon]
MPDTHALPPTHGRFDLRRVGIEGIRKPIHVLRAGRDIVLSTEFSVAVDLPASRKGSDLSRNAEILAEITERTSQHPVGSLEAACSQIARELLVRHPSASESQVVASAEYFLRQGIAPGRESYEDFRLLAESRASRANGSVRIVRSIGAEGVGMTACPCAMESCRELLVREFPELAEPRWKDLPMISHNQRNRTRLELEAPEGVDIEADDLLAAIASAQSSPTFAILKRDEEAQVVLNAHRRPRFVEDVLRELLAGLPARFPHLPDEVEVRAETVSEESIHKYDVRASHRTTLGELRRATAL